jgi:predicted nuclease with TOPRIM domain
VTEKSKRGHREAQEGLERLQTEKERLQRGLERMQSGGNREVIERLQRGHREDEKRHRNMLKISCDSLVELEYLFSSLRSLCAVLLLL